MSTVLLFKSTKVIKAMASPAVATVLLIYLFILVLATTVTQVYIGIFAAKKIVMDSWLIWIHWHGYVIPVGLGGWTVGVALLISMIGALMTRIPFNFKHAGLWLAHGGAILLILGAGLSSGIGQEAQLVLEEGQSKNYAEMPHHTELVVQHVTDKGIREVMFNEALFLEKGETLTHAQLPFQLKVLAAYRNSRRVEKQSDFALTADNLATDGAGQGMKIVPEDPVFRDDYQNDPAAYVEVQMNGKPEGRFLLANFIEFGQRVMIKNQTYVLQIRPKRMYLPISVYLKNFEHQQHPGTTIPSWFSSEVMISNTVTNEKRDVTISMNHPLRYDGKTFYQASFGKNDTQTVLQVVDNPAWLVPYISCFLIALGLLLHFAAKYRRTGKE